MFKRSVVGVQWVMGIGVTCGGCLVWGGVGGCQKMIGYLRMRSKFEYILMCILVYYLLVPSYARLH